LMALFMFWGGEKLEAIFGKKDLKKEPKSRVLGAVGITAVALVVLILGQPTNSEKWARIAPEKQAALDQRTVQVHPGELLASLANKKLNIIMIDVRSEVDFNLFHITGAQNIPLAELNSILPGLLSQNSANTVVVLMSNDEKAATDAWKYLVTEAVPNVYILDGGVNNWISVFRNDDPTIHPVQGVAGKDLLHFTFDAALGDRYDSAHPKPYEWTTLEYTPKIQLKLQRGPSGGGCG
jgi:rhodanese-related sulfurtransferase